MSSINVIKKKINSISSTIKITNAMYLVASSKLQKTQSKYRIIKPYFDNYYKTINKILSNISELKLSSFNDIKNHENHTLYIIIGSNIGMCGSYNLNINKIVNKEIKTNDYIIAVGKKINEIWKNKSNINFLKYVQIDEKDSISYAIADEIAELSLELFATKKVNTIKLVYSKVINALENEPIIIELLPLKKINSDEKDFLTSFEPNPDNIIDGIIDNYIATIVLGALYESKIAEYSSRRNAMDNATNNANDLSDKYKLQYNSARQAKITNEINEIVAGSSTNKE